jgi:anti-anti-sigma factor
MSVPIASSSRIDRAESHTAYFATRWLHPSSAVITVHGDLDASNAQEFADYALRHSEHTERLVLDLSGVDFFGTAGFSALHTVNVRCAGAGVDWALVSSSGVSRLLRICDPDSALPVVGTVQAALSMVEGEPRRLLQLVSQPR